MTQEDMNRYYCALHAMQTGVGTMIGIDPQDMTPKHMRVGINSSMVEDATLVKLLIQKGIITQDEYEKALADEMEAEVERYKQKIKERTGIEVDLV